MSGLTTSREIVRRWPKVRRPFMIAMTANVLPGDRELCLDAGMDDYLAKPVLRQDLAAALCRAGADVRVGHEPSVAPALAASLNREVAAAQPRALRVLLADDNLINQEIASAQFASLGYQVCMASDGMEVLDVLEHRQFDVVFMDVQMPVLGGLAATRSICAQADGGRRPRIIGLTADASEEQRQQCLAAGMDDCLAKPISRPLLAEILLSIPLSCGAEAQGPAEEFGRGAANS